MRCAPARKSTRQRPNVIHVPIRPTAGSAHSKSPSHDFVTKPRPIVRRNSLSGPDGVVDPHERLRHDDRRDRLRHEQHRAEEHEAAHPEAGQQRRQEEPDRDREDRVEEDQLDRVLERAADLGRVVQLAIVVDPDPLLRRDAVPFVEGQPHRLQEREEREDQIRTRAPAGCTGRRRGAARPARARWACGDAAAARPGSLPGALGGRWWPLSPERHRSLDRLVELRPLGLDDLGGRPPGVCRPAIIFWNSAPIDGQHSVDAQSGKSVRPLLLTSCCQPVATEVRYGVALRGGRARDRRHLVLGVHQLGRARAAISR